MKKNLLIPIVCILFLASCGSSSKTKSDLSPADNTGTYAPVLVKCIGVGYPDTAISDICSLDTLPFLGQETNSPTIDDVKKRLVVSHDWMAENFIAILEQMPESTLNMFRSVTGIVIADDINPSYFWMGNGAIYFNATAMALSVVESKDIDPDAQDKRLDYGLTLSFLETYRYFDANGTNIYRGLNNSERSFEDILLPNAAVIFHELSHAIDIFPPAQFANFNNSKKPFQNRLTDLSTGWLSEYPITDSNDDMTVLTDIAHIFNAGEDATDYLDYSAADVGEIFSRTHATDLYGFYNEKEDFAMNIEEALMLYYFNVDREYVFVDTPPEGVAFEDWHFPIAWGQRNRIFDENVIDRAAAAVELILGEQSTEVTDYLYAQDGPTQIKSGTHFRHKREPFEWRSKFFDNYR